MSSIRALAADLALRSDNQLRMLFAARPDLIQPAVPDLAALAARASTRISVQRALENLPTPQLQVLEAIHLGTNEDAQLSTTASWLKPVIGGSTIKALDEILARLHALALIHRAEPHPGAPKAVARRRFFLPVSSLKDVIGPYPAGLGRSYLALASGSAAFGHRAVELVAALRAAGYGLEPADTARSAAHSLHMWTSDPQQWDTLMAAAPEHTRDLLDRFRNWAVGAVPRAGRIVSLPDEPGDVTPVDWLLARGILVPLDSEHVELPRSAGQSARGHLIIESLQLAPHPAQLRSTRPALRDNAAFGSIAEILRQLTELMAHLEHQQLATLRAGGIGVREVRRIGDLLRLDAARASMLVELAAVSGLIIQDPDTARWVRAAAAAHWLTCARHEQWSAVVRSWLITNRAPSLVGEPLPAGAAINVLAPEAARPEAPLIRRRTLAVLVELSEEYDGDGTPVLDAESVLVRLSWHQPRLHRRFRRLVPGILAEAELLGLTGSGALTGLGAAIADADAARAAALLADALPKPVDRIKVQADLTAVAPGYLEPAVARELAVLAGTEGQGPASIYRFSAASIRRALDTGRDAESILDFLRAHSATELPQPLVYLVEDTAARYGRLRVGAAPSYLRSDDETALEALLADPRTVALGLVRLAPTVLACRAGIRELYMVLSDLGLSAALESDGVLVPGDAGSGIGPTGIGPTGMDALRSGTVGPGIGFSPAGQVPGEEEMAAQLIALRSPVPRAGPAGGAEAAPALGIETLQRAIRLKRPVNIRIVDGRGNHQRELLVPLSVTGGRVRVFDPRRETERVVSIHRVMDVELAEGPSTND